MILKDDFLRVTGRPLEEVVSELHLKEESYARVLKISVMTTEQSILELATAVGADDRLKAQRIAHDLKGVFGNLRIEPLARMAIDIETQAKSEAGPMWESFEQFSGKFDALKNVFQKEGVTHVENPGR
jgi:HPt (histidine-containing phosphotransfer) domain-containing protein